MICGTVLSTKHLYNKCNGNARQADNSRTNLNLVPKDAHDMIPDNNAYQVPTWTLVVASKISVFGARIQISSSLPISNRTQSRHDMYKCGSAFDIVSLIGMLA